MKNWWIKFGCFLIGYNYRILKDSSEASAKEVKKYTSAILIVCILWGFVGYTFSQQYMQLDALYSAVVACVMVFIVIQIERQIILTFDKNRWATAFRVGIAVVMAILGATIIDQVIFKEDIALGKEAHIQEKVELLLPNKLKEIDEGLRNIDSLIQAKEQERLKLMDEVSKKPTLKLRTRKSNKIPSTTSKTVKDSLGREIITREDKTYIKITYEWATQPNPKWEQIEPLANEIKELRTRAEGYRVNRSLDVREGLEEDLKSKTGFLDELDIMYKILKDSWIALVFYILWLLFFCCIELFVLANKIGKSKSAETDYEATIKHQREIRKKAIEELAKK